MAATASFVLNCPKCAMPFNTSADLDRHLEAEHDVIEDEDLFDEEMLMEGVDGKKIVVSAAELILKNGQRSLSITKSTRHLSISRHQLRFKKT